MPTAIFQSMPGDTNGPGETCFHCCLQIGMLLAIFQLLGTPADAQWPGVSSLRNWCPLFPRFRARGLAQVMSVQF